MRAEIIFIGTELLLGQIQNTNAVFLGQELSTLGIDCFYQSVVGDNKERIKNSFQTALQRADLIITTGGLGPTSDDLTTECWAELFDEEMVFCEDTFYRVKQVFERANKQMSESNRKLAYRPKSSLELPNGTGSAPGIIWDVTDLYQKKLQKQNLTKGYKKYVLTFPGVPREMKQMWKDEAVPFLQKLFNNQGANQQLFYKELKFYGIGESALAEKVQDLLDLNDPTTAPLAGQGECRLRIATKAKSKTEAEKKIFEVEKKIKNRAGEFCYGSDKDTLESVVGNLLKDKQLTLSIAESCTGGLLSKRLTDVPGSSAFVSLNMTTYSNKSKMQILNVREETLRKHGAVSGETAVEMARGIKNLAKTNCALSVTGVAGPDGGTDHKPVGTVFLCFIDQNDKEFIIKHNFGKRTREDIRWSSSQQALDIVRRKLV